MKFSYKYILALIVVITTVSCQKDIKVKVPDIQDGLTLFCKTETGSKMNVIVGKSRGILKYNRNQEMFVKTATVKLYADGLYVETLRFNDSFQAYTSDVIIQPAKLYKLTVDAPGYTGIEAEATAPAKVPLGILSIKDTMIISPYGQFYMEAAAITIRFDDPISTSDYYQLNFYSADGFLGGNELYPSSECLNIKDPSIEIDPDVIDGGDCVNGNVIFTDELFNGKSKQLTAYISTYSLFPIPDDQGDSSYPTFMLSRISEARYRYAKSNEKSMDVDGNPFAEPVNVYTNIKNGYGIFTITDPSIVEIHRR